VGDCKQGERKMMGLGGGDRVEGMGGLLYEAIRRGRVESGDGGWYKKREEDEDEIQWKEIEKVMKSMKDGRR